MVKLQSVHIKRFKVIEDAPFDLGELNLLVGANNAGKSSIIQALHFGIALLQSIALNNQWDRNIKKSQDALSTSISPSQLVYSPAEDANHLGMGGSLKEDQDLAIVIEFGLSNGARPSISVRKGRNRNILISVENATAAEPLASLKEPFSVFSPGLAGVSKAEQYVSDGVLLRTIARGDANLVLRNILYRLWDTDLWSAFIGDLREVFPKVDFNVSFNRETDEFIMVRAKAGEDWVPLELVGTGVLQATQILSYIHRFSPSLVVLDEPDSHLHPNNQRLLCSLLKMVATDRETQILLTTHSRHVVDAIASHSRCLWVRNGTVTLAGPDDEIGILLDIGALDIKERVGQDAVAIVLTEDENPRILRALLKSAGFPEGETIVLPYYGVTSIKQLRPLVKMISSVNTRAKIVLHRDRDYLFESEAEDWAKSVRQLGVEPFLTKGTDLESHCLNSQHLSDVNPDVDKKIIEKLLTQAIEETKDESIKYYVNGRLAIERANGRAGKINHGELALEASKVVTENLERYTHGKTALRTLRRIYQKQFAKNLQDAVPSRHLMTDVLGAIAKKLPTVQNAGRAK